MRNHDVVNFAFDGHDPSVLGRARLVEDFFVEVSRIASLRNRSDLTTLVGALEPQAMSRPLQAMTAFGRRGGRSYAVFVKQDRDRPLHRKDVAQRLDQEIRLRFPRWRANDPGACEFWVFWNKTASINLRMTTEAFKYRGETPSERFGALRPTVAAAVVDVLKPSAGEHVVDPMCGSGTLLLESVDADVRLSGFDSDSEAVDLARRRLGARAAIELATPGGLTDSYDALIANVPWGAEFAAVDADRTVALWRSVPRCVVFVERREPWLRAFDREGFRTRTLRRILVRGRWAHVIRAERRSR